MWLVCQSLMICNVLPPSLLPLPHSPSLYFFSWPAGCHSHILSGPLCFTLPQPTVYLYHFPPSAPASFSSFQRWSPRGEQVGLTSDLQWISVVFVNVRVYSFMARNFKAAQMFQIHAYIVLDPCTLMNYSLCFHWAGAQEMEREGMGWIRSELKRKEAVAVSWGMGVSLLIILVHPLNLP